MPRHRITTPSGHTLGVNESGDPNGVAVITHHGTPSSSVQYAAHVKLAGEQGIRFITFDRAGYGDSDRNPGRAVADCVADVHAIADALGLERFASWGISGGGPHALACAALCDERLFAVASLAAVAPYDADGLDWLEGMGQDNIDEFGAVLAGADELNAFLTEAHAQQRNATPEGIVAVLDSLLGPEDRSVLNGALAAWMIEASSFGLKDSIDGWFDDDVAFSEPWGFDIAQINRPVLLLQGGDDRFVPVAHGEWLAARVPGVEARITAADGHLTLLERHLRETHEWLLARQ